MIGLFSAGTVGSSGNQEEGIEQKKGRFEGTGQPLRVIDQENIANWEGNYTPADTAIIVNFRPNVNRKD
ncbi:hypothetical protein L21SP2_1409 [Salinispira pacifica]|uniref:Uncharacterized protein n=1 Tax=Salinispira pacifica TaxID=1307761 RepID=V5WG88_9SPIO|nr:hypothetical protein L21SP2_1409 [Salinispira pacifica]